ncbi:TOM1-like protein 1 isoform X2 [Pristis pectinata]|uniref:TOM1-like protein 1 isoform X2 n=1 Tax=Pristis pectinata TaxID=685728 RepID=UPI00223D9E5B|nr:TOM1-like protein 1 isoform X2 [Pristis pectinata]XP_051889168.1 TOM1-like protein 1 isoform X2 [Pristis pectinata]
MAFGKNLKDPFGTRVGKLIDIATIGTQPAADWSQFNHICDIINSSEEGPKDAVKALKKRIAGNRNYKEIRLSLSLIDCCMRNCGPSFRSLMVRRDFVKDVLAKLLKPKYNPPTDVQNHILGLIQSWAITYQGPIDVSDVRELYMDMKRKGLIFPDPALGPPGIRADPVGTSLPRRPPTAATMKPAASRAPLPRNAITLVPEQLAKLHSELDLVHMNITVMSAILLENIPGFENPDDMLLLQQLHSTCREMQERIGLLLPQVDDQPLTSCLLSANDQLNRAFLSYERFQRSRTRSQWAEKEATDTPKVVPVDPSAPCSTPDLINFTCPDLGPVCTDQFSNLSLRNGNAAVGVCVANPSLRSRALPDVPSPNTAPTHQPESGLPPPSTAPEPLYANVSQQGSEPPTAPVYSQLSGPPHADRSWGHTGRFMKIWTLF